MNSETPAINRAFSAADIETVRTLFLEYAKWLNFDLCFQGFDEEVRTLPGSYSPPRGCLYLAKINEAPMGCIGLRPFSADVCEMKRLYVRDAARGLGLGRALTTAIIADAKFIGYHAMRLDTIPAMAAAVSLYRSLGFKEIAPYRKNPVPGALFFELDLRT